MRLWKRWVDACAQQESGTSIALFRLAIGLCVMWTLASVWMDGLVDALWVDRAFGGMRRLPDHWLTDAMGGRTPTAIRTLILAGIGMGAALALGLGARVAALASLILLGAVVEANNLAGGSYDRLLQNALWLCVVMPTSRTMSLDAKLRTGHFFDRRTVGSWCRWLIVAQLVIMYTSTGWQKLSSAWMPGGGFSALYYILQQPTWQRFDMEWVAFVYPLTQIGTVVSWLWEVTGPLFAISIWATGRTGPIKRLGIWGRRVYVLIGLTMHISLLFLMNVGPFTPITLAYYAAVYRPEEWERWLSSSDAQSAVQHR